MSKMVEIRFPSKSFSVEFDQEIANGRDFSVWIIADERVRETVRRQIGYLISLDPPSTGLVKDAMEKFKLRDLISSFADAVSNHGYKASIVEGQDLIILFRKT